MADTGVKGQNTDGPAPRPDEAPLDAAGLGIYAMTVLVWGSTWVALIYQRGVAAEVSVIWRFALASAIMFIWVILRGERLAFPVRAHVRFVALGALLFSTNFVLFYIAAQYLVTGLLSVVLSLAAILNILFSALFFGEKISARAATGAMMGMGGVAAMFWPEINGVDFDRQALIGLGLCVCATTSFSLGSMVSSANQRAGLPIFPTTAWAMAYGAGLVALVAIALGRDFNILWTVHYVGSLIYLTVFGSIVAFAGYLTLLGRIGGGRAGYVTVMFPVVALGLSTLFEGYVWTPVALTGLALVMLGNLFVLRGG